MEGFKQADILAALQRQSTKPPPPTKQYKDLQKSDLHNDAKVNTRKLYCPREGCRAVIVQPGTAELIEGKEDVVSHTISARLSCLCVGQLASSVAVTWTCGNGMSQAC